MKDSIVPSYLLINCPHKKMKDYVVPSYL